MDDFLKVVIGFTQTESSSGSPYDYMAEEIEPPEEDFWINEVDGNDKILLYPLSGDV